VDRIPEIETPLFLCMFAIIIIFLKRRFFPGLKITNSCADDSDAEAPARCGDSGIVTGTVFLPPTEKPRQHSQYIPFAFLILLYHPRYFHNFILTRKGQRRKMGCLGNSKTEDQRIDEKAQREANKKIEKQLQKERQAYKATHRLLLLGKVLFVACVHVSECLSFFAEHVPVLTAAALAILCQGGGCGWKRSRAYNHIQSQNICPFFFSAACQDVFLRVVVTCCRVLALCPRCG